MVSLQEEIGLLPKAIYSIYRELESGAHRHHQTNNNEHMYVLSAR